MNEEIAWRVILSVKPGQLDEFRMLTAEMVEVNKVTSGTRHDHAHIAAPSATRTVTWKMPSSMHGVRRSERNSESLVIQTENAPHFASPLHGVPWFSRTPYPLLWF